MITIYTYKYSYIISPYRYDVLLLFGSHAEMTILSLLLLWFLAVSASPAYVSYHKCFVLTFLQSLFSICIATRYMHRWFLLLNARASHQLCVIRNTLEGKCKLNWLKSTNFVFLPSTATALWRHTYIPLSFYGFTVIPCSHSHCFWHICCTYVIVISVIPFYKCIFTLSVCQK